MEQLVDLGRVAPAQVVADARNLLHILSQQLRQQILRRYRGGSQQQGKACAILILEDLLQCSAVRQDFFGCRIDPLALRCQPHPAACVTVQQAGGQSRLQCRQMCADGGLAEEQGLRCLCKAPQFRHGHEYLDLFQAEFAHVCLLAA